MNTSNPSTYFGIRFTALLLLSAPVVAQSETEERSSPWTLSARPPAQPSKNPPESFEWQYGGFLDVGYLFDFNHPTNKLFRSRGTAWHVDDLHLNMRRWFFRRW